VETTTRSLRPMTAAILLAWGGAPGALAQALRPPEPGWQPSATFTPWFRGRADFGGGGGFEASGGMIRAGLDGPVGNGLRAGLTLSYDFTHYAFSSPGAFGVAPWSDVHRVGLSVSILIQGPAEWSFLASPSLDYFLEDGADSSKAATFGGVLAVSRWYGPDLRLGLGAILFDRLGQFVVIPFPLIDWKITDRLRLANPLAAGPTGGAGLEISYAIDGGWTFGAGGAYRSVRFRLREQGPTPNGIGGERAVPAFVHAGRRFGRSIALDVYAGALLGGQVSVEDSGGRVTEQDFDPAPLIGGTLSARF